MMLAEITPDGDLYEYLENAVLILLVVGGIALVLCNFVMGGGSIASASSRSRKYGSLQDSLDSNSNEKPQPSALLAALAPRPQQAKGRDRRTSVRRKGNPVGIVLLAGDGTNAEPGLVLNRSKGGLCVTLSSPVAVGTTVQIRACQAPEDAPWVSIVVRHCVSKGKQWQLGCQFVEELPWSVLLLFG
ncbi:MAG TPA: PilZ domain-containing protein [Gemmataceae bacterium]|nr:PilZ domain-containing protein [Gemmataceae bacterium]